MRSALQSPLAGIPSPFGRRRRGGFSIAALFPNDERGAWLEPVSDFVTTDAESGISTITARAGTITEATQTVPDARPTFDDPGMTFDLVDDNLDMDFTGSGGFEATLLQGSAEGIIHAKVSVPDDVYTITQDPSFFASGNIRGGYVLREGDLTSSEVTSVKNSLLSGGSGANFAGVTSMQEWFRDRTDLVELYSGDWDTSSVTDFLAFARGASSLVTLDVSGWDTSSVTNFGFFARGASSLVTLDVSGWDTSSVNDFGDFANGASSLTTVTVNGGTGNPFADSPCTDYGLAFADTNLTQQSIDDILVAINAAGTSNGTFDQSGGSAPSTTGETAIDAMRGRGWTITVTGGY